MHWVFGTIVVIITLTNVHIQPHTQLQLSQESLFSKSLLLYLDSSNLQGHTRIKDLIQKALSEKPVKYVKRNIVYERLHQYPIPGNLYGVTILFCLTVSTILAGVGDESVHCNWFSGSMDGFRLNLFKSFLFVHHCSDRWYKLIEVMITVVS